MSNPVTKEEIQKHEANIIKIIKDNNVCWITDIFVYYRRITKKTFYNYSLDESEEIADAIEANRLKGRESLLAKWANSENSTLQLALFKLMAEDSQRKAIAMNYIDVTSKGEKLQSINLVDANEDKE